jgi:sterol desaturase/sphingolipid hydroxylase (fatty acid hydroxylase superfamily)
VSYGVLQSIALGFLISHLIRWIDATGAIPRVHVVSDWPVPLQVLFFVVLHDLYIYGFHRLQHRFEPLWRIHEAHHSATHVDWIAGARSHSLEILVNQSIEFGAVIFLGGAPEVAMWKGIISAVWGNWIHSNIDVRSGWLQYVINGPEMHRWHHAVDIPPPGVNFGTKLAIWDWMFGTAYRPADRRPSGYGLGQPFPQTWLGQHAYAFRPFPGAAPPSEKEAHAA